MFCVVCNAIDDEGVNVLYAYRWQPPACWHVTGRVVQPSWKSMAEPGIETPTFVAVHVSLADVLVVTALCVALGSSASALGAPPPLRTATVRRVSRRRWYRMPRCCGAAAPPPIGVRGSL
jgi:hypothetical protein